MDDSTTPAAGTRPNPLRAVLATLLPAAAPFPDGGCITEAVAAALGDDDAVLRALPPGFAPGDEASLRAIEAADPAAFGRLLRAAYLAYYTHPAVQAAVEATTGYPARPPQPLGYALPPE